MHIIKIHQSKIIDINLQYWKWLNVTIRCFLFAFSCVKSIVNKIMSSESHAAVWVGACGKNLFGRSTVSFMSHVPKVLFSSLLKAGVRIDYVLLLLLSSPTGVSYFYLSIGFTHYGFNILCHFWPILCSHRWIFMVEQFSQFIEVYNPNWYMLMERLLALFLISVEKCKRDAQNSMLSVFLSWSHPRSFYMRI